jgi:hypothetical protein
MGRKCADGQLDGMAVFTDEDVHSCELGGGRVVSDGNTGGCGASNIAAMGSQRNREEVLFPRTRRSRRCGEFVLAAGSIPRCKPR